VKTRLAFLAAMMLGTGFSRARAAAPADVPCGVTNEVAPAYPSREFHNGIIAGRARLLLRVDPQGNLVDALVAGYTLPGFAEAAMNAVKRWKFEPARIDGRPAFANLDVTFAFDVNRPLATAVYGPRDESPVALANYQDGAVSASQLDQPLAPLSTVAPAYPADWAQRGIKGSVVVEFYVDETGRVRLPAIVSTDRPELGWIAVPAIEQWRFPPPTRHGQPVLVKAQQAFQF